MLYWGGGYRFFASIISFVTPNLALVTPTMSVCSILKVKTARDCYATILRRAGVSKDDIGEVLGNANSIVTEHYLTSLDIEKKYEINKHIL